MKKNWITILIVFLLPIVAYFVMNLLNISDYMSVDAKTSKPQIIKFTSAMCLDCQTMNKIMKEVYPEFKDSIDLVEIHVQNQNKENQKWIRKYNVTLVPTIILINSNGSQVRRIEGAISKDKLIECFKELK